MNLGKTVFAQLMSIIPNHEFNKCVARYNGNYRVKEFNCKEHFLVMSFAQLTYRESLRDIESCLHAVSKKLYHSGIKKPVARNTLAKENERRNSNIYADFAQVLAKEARQLYAQENAFLNDLDHMAFALDSTTIDLCLQLFPWAKFRQNKGAVKMHTLLDLQGSIPTFIRITPGSVHDVNILDDLPIQPGAFYVMDMGYIDYHRLYKIHKSGAYFVIRAKENMSYDRVYSHRAYREFGIGVDQTIKFRNHVSKEKYPDHLRRIKYTDYEKNKTFFFLTNHFGIEAIKIAGIYRERWKIELFFRWIKQHLRIKSFYGTSENAVHCQIWIAICTYLLVAIAKKRLQISASLYSFLQIISISIFEKEPVNQLVRDSSSQIKDYEFSNQLKMF
jgi:transposase